MTTLLIGATGLIGYYVDFYSLPRQLVRLQRTSRDRKPVFGQHTKVADSTRWPGMIAKIAPETLVCCVGTTMRKAGGAAQFRNVDQHLVIACAAAARSAGTRHMVVVTSVGANSRVDNVYLNAKGMVEDELTALAFDRFDIIRPGLLIGLRRESRPMEAIGQKLAPYVDPLLFGGLRKFRSIGAETVAKAIWTLVDGGGSGRFIHHNDELTALAVDFARDRRQGSEVADEAGERPF